MGLEKDSALQIKEEIYIPFIKNKEILSTRRSIEDSRERPDSHRDYTRILYSSAFRRLQGKMQLLGISSSNFFRNRLTHSLEVCQIARSIAEDIGYEKDDIYVVEAASLAHDIGNPPFGHYGERILDRLVKEKVDGDKCEGFESNAQTLRVLTTLQSKKPKLSGLNLTVRTLLATTKYFYSFDNRTDDGKYIYSDDYSYLYKIVKNNSLPLRTIDMQIMDLSDEIAYAAHDLEDALDKKIFTIDEFLSEFTNYVKNNKTFADTEKKYTITKMKWLIRKAKTKVFNPYSERFYSMFTKELGSSLIYHLINDITLINKGKVKEIGFKKLKPLSHSIKKVTFDCILKSNEVRYYEKRGEIILTDLFNFFYDNWEFLPVEYRNMIKIGPDDSKIKSRVVCDYISGMMDLYAEEIHKEIFGKTCLDNFGISKTYYFKER